MKALAKPPDLVKTVVFSVCCLFGKKENWEDARKFLGQIDFKDQLISYSEGIDDYPDARFKKFR